jgi:hypothetical protein
LFKRCSTCFGQHFAHHQEHFLNCLLLLLTYRPRQETHPPWLLYGNRRLRLQFKKCSWWWAKSCPKHVEQRLNNKRFYNWVCIWLVILFGDYSDFHFNMFPSYIKIESNNPKKFKLILQKFLYENSLYSVDEYFEIQNNWVYLYIISIGGKAMATYP